MNMYKDRESYNQWLYAVKENKIWEAEEVVQILKEFGAKLGEELLSRGQFGPQLIASSKRRRIQ
jgi:hypothetical protein